jgi:hypothetical protein
MVDQHAASPADNPGLLEPEGDLSRFAMQLEDPDEFGGVRGLVFQIVGPDSDQNQDGVVDGHDYTVWRDNLGGSSAGISGADLADWQANYGAGTSMDVADYGIWRTTFGANVPSSNANDDDDGGEVLILDIVDSASDSANSDQGFYIAIHLTQVR